MYPCLHALRETLFLHLPQIALPQFPDLVHHQPAGIPKFHTGTLLNAQLFAGEQFSNGNDRTVKQPGLLLLTGVIQTGKIEAWFW